jgi:biotin synthase
MTTITKEIEEELLNAPLNELLSKADKIRQTFIDTKLELCSILNTRCGRCSEDCKFCAQSARYSAGISTYPLKQSGQIIEAAQKAKAIGAERFGIVTSGNRITDEELDAIARAISQIKETMDIDICCSLGALTKPQLKILKDCGLSRYHHNIETSRRFYPSLVSTHTFDERINTITSAKDVGLEVCSGGIIGMGENWADRIDMARILKKLDVDSIPINILIPIEGTPLEFVKPISVEDILRTICIFRIILKDKTIKIAAGREAVLKDSQLSGFAAGANGMLIGGYLTIKGNTLEADYALIEEIKKLWTR